MKTRFAPSPTGFLHIGGLRTALFAYLEAHKNGGTFLLRLEDTDRERFVEGGAENILKALEWANVKIDEGVVLKENKVSQIGDNGPYIQSERLDIYKKYIEELLEKEQAYYCFCTKERLDELRKVQELNKKATGYDRHCRNLDKEEIEKNLEQNLPHVIRLKMPTEGTTEFEDKVRGKVSFENVLIDDQVLIKSDGFPTYHFAVVVDDHLMEITDIIRGEEWLPSIPKHIILYQAFGWDIPNYAHLPLLVNEQKQKLSKRHGDVSVEDFKEKGYLAEALVNFIAFLGWNPGTDKEIYSLEKLKQDFAIAKVGKAAAVFNREKLDWYNKQYITQMDLNELTKRTIPFFKNFGILNKDEIDDQEKFEALKKIVGLEQGRASTLVELVEATGFMFADELDYDKELLAWRKSTLQDAKEKLGLVKELLEKIENWDKNSIEEILFKWIEDNQYGKGDVLWPLRVALSGQKNSPGPTEIAQALGKTKTLQRIEATISKI